MISLNAKESWRKDVVVVLAVVVVVVMVVVAIVIVVVYITHSVYVSVGYHFHLAFCSLFQLGSCLQLFLVHCVHCVILFHSMILSFLYNSFTLIFIKSETPACSLEG